MPLDSLAETSQPGSLPGCGLAVMFLVAPHQIQDSFLAQVRYFPISSRFVSDYLAWPSASTVCLLARVITTISSGGALPRLIGPQSLGVDGPRVVRGDQILAIRSSLFAGLASQRRTDKRMCLPSAVPFARPPRIWRLAFLPLCKPLRRDIWASNGCSLYRCVSLPSLTIPLLQLLFIHYYCPYSLTLADGAGYCYWLEALIQYGYFPFAGTVRAFDGL